MLMELLLQTKKHKALCFNQWLFSAINARCHLASFWFGVVTDKNDVQLKPFKAGV